LFFVRAATASCTGASTAGFFSVRVFEIGAFAAGLLAADFLDNIGRNEVAGLQDGMECLLLSTLKFVSVNCRSFTLIVFRSLGAVAVPDVRKWVQKVEVALHRLSPPFELPLLHRGVFDRGSERGLVHVPFSAVRRELRAFCLSP
jgi:hypothetical protein